MGKVFFIMINILNKYIILPVRTAQFVLTVDSSFINVHAEPFFTYIFFGRLQKEVKWYIGLIFYYTKSFCSAAWD